MKSRSRFLAFFAAGLLALSSILIGGTMLKAQAQGAFPGQYYAPYQDITIGPTLQSVTQSTGIKFYTLAFVTNGGGSCNAEWAGTIPLNQTSTFLPHLDSDIQFIRNQGGDVIISFGGAAGQELALTCSSASALQAQYQVIINQYHVTHLDFDIEGGAQGDANSYDRRNTALRALQQANPGLSIAFTLPSATTGLLDDSMGLLRNANSHGVNYSIVNLMTMDYGSPDSQMGQEAINAANGLFSELQSLFPSKSSSQLWAMVGITPMIGQNDSQGEIFSLQNAQQVLSFAQQNHIGELAMWEISRDNGSCAGSTTASDSCSGVSQSAFAFSNIFQQFTGGGGANPTPTPSPTKTITPSPTQPVTPTPTPPQAGNLVANPGFESGNLSSWQCDASDKVVTSPVHSGQDALQITTTSSSIGQCTQTITVQANHTYTLSAFVQGNFAFIGINGGASNWTTSASYTKLSVQFSSGSATSVTIFIHGWYAQGNVFVDDVSVQ